MAYNIRLAVFEGPFDLLFHLIEKNEVDIYDIPIAEITDQYLAYLATMQILDLDVASEFLVMAATLLSIKAKMLLPKPPKEEEGDEEEFGLDPRDELVERLLEYKRFKMVAEFLKGLEKEQEKVYTRPNEEEMFIHLFSEENPVQGIDMKDLLGALKVVLDRVVEEEITGEIKKDEITVRDKMKEIVGRLSFKPGGLAFGELFPGKVRRVEIVVTFLALLELIKLGKVRVFQSKLFGEIRIFSPQEEIA